MLLRAQFALLFAFFMSLLSLAVLLTRRVRSGKRILAFCLLSSTFWALTELLLQYPFTSEQKILITRIQYLFITTVPLSYVFFAFNFLGWKRLLRPVNVAILFLLPFFTLIGAWTNDFHGLLWAEMEIRTIQSVDMLIWTHGALFYLYLAYCYFLVFFAGIACLHRGLGQKDLFRSQSFIIFLGALIPVLGNLIYLTGLDRALPVDYTPVAFSLTCLLLTAGFFSYRLQDLRPFASNMIFKGITDGLIVINQQNEIVHLNNRMNVILNQGDRSLTGAHQDLLFRVFPELEKEDLYAGLTIHDKVYDLYFDVSKTSLKNNFNRKIGEMYLFRDITQRKLLEEELRKLAQEDELTGLLNRRSFMGRVESEIERIRRYGGKGAMIMLDLDHFKRINDEYGHLAGDLVLRTLGTLLLSFFRASDVAGRFGGEEFAIFLPESDQEQTGIIAERLREKWEKLKIEYESQELLSTLSAGFTLLQGAEDRLEKVIHRADDAMYKAKKKGRNRVEFIL